MISRTKTVPACSDECHGDPGSATLQEADLGRRRKEPIRSAILQHLVVLVLAAAVQSQVPTSAPTETVGAVPYPVDVTEASLKDENVLKELRRPGTVLHSDDFESPDALKRYFEVRGADDGRVRLDKTAGVARAGATALRCRAPAADGRASGAGVSFWFGPGGHDRVHLRYWMKFAADYDQGHLNHTGGGLSGVAGNDKWRGMGTAGLRPAGDDHFSARFEGWRDWGRHAPPGYLFCYTYWMDMNRDKDGNFWGNMLGPAKEARFVPERDRWYCHELMVRVNQVGKADGELAAWVDGRLYLHHTGFRWRSTKDVRLKRFGLDIYVHAATRDNVVWFDDVVLSTGHVGVAE